MGVGMISIGVSGLTAAQYALVATEHNVVNASTPGYSRQGVVLTTNTAIATGAGALGQGVRVVTVERMYDRFLTSQVNTAQTKVSELESFYSAIKQIDDMLADPDAGLSPSLQDFFSGAQQVASNPSLLAARQSMISSAQTLATRLQSLDTRLTEIADQINDRISSVVKDINAYATEIADINQRIIVAESTYGQPANDLLDTRDRIVSDLNKLIKATPSENSDGSYNIFVGSGQQLVVGSQAMQLTSEPSSADPSRLAIGLKTYGGSQELPEKLIVGGELGGLIYFRRDALDGVTNELGRVAASLALTFNAQHALGQNLQDKIAGDLGFIGDFFTVSAPKLISDDVNTGTASISASFQAPTQNSAGGAFYTNLTTSNYRLDFGGAGSYTVTRLTDNVNVASSSGTGSISFDGITLNISALGNNGDRFLIQPTAEVARNFGVDSRMAADPRLVAVAAPIRTLPDVSNTGYMTLSQGVAHVGYDASGLPVALTATATTLNGAPGSWVARYSDGTETPSSTGSINLLSGSATLVGLTLLNSAGNPSLGFEIAGVPDAGDVFNLKRNFGGVEDGRNAVLFTGLQTSNTVAGGTATYQSAYARLVADVGIQTREIKVRLTSQQAVLNQSTTARDALSGVNLDEEAANLIRFQQAYQASSKILEVGSKLFETILSIA